MNKVKDILRNGGTVMVFNPNFPSRALVEHAGELKQQGLRWFTINAKNLLARRTREINVLLDTIPNSTAAVNCGRLA